MLLCCTVSCLSSKESFGGTGLLEASAGVSRKVFLGGLLQVLQGVLLFSFAAVLLTSFWTPVVKRGWFTNRCAEPEARVEAVENEGGCKGNTWKNGLSTRLKSILF